MKTGLQRIASLIVLAGLLASCASLGFNERMAYGYSAVTAARDTAGELLDAGTISADDAANVQAQADNLRAGLDIARSVYAADPTAGSDKLTAALAGLDALSVYLRSREP